MYRVYLDGILQDENDVLDINQSFEVGIVREDGFTNTEQILREKSEAKIGFCGAAFTYICTKRRQSICTKILFSVGFVCDGIEEQIFEGYISQDAIEIRPRQCIATVTAIKDNSFSGLFRDYIDTEVPLYYNKTTQCNSVAIPERTIEMYDDPANLASTVNISAFDVFDTLNYIVKYFTDNQVYVVSDYLTAASTDGMRYAITTGYNMHNTTTTVQEKYPVVSFSALFAEIRKKTRLYMVIEYDTDNMPYLRIEPETYSFAEGVTLLEITDVPITTTETIDYTRFFNSVKVGSQSTELQTGSTEYYPNSDLEAWTSETYNSCSECTADKDSEGVVLDLLSEYIIDSNVIYEALQQADGADYANDGSIFLFEYEVAADGTSNAIITLVAGDNIYNDSLRNENVINRWLGYTPLCISLSSTTENYFLARRAFDQIGTGTFPDATFEFALRFNTEVIDNAGNYLYPYTLSGNPVSQFTAPVTGSYRFVISQNVFISDLDCLSSTDFSTYQLGVDVRDSGDNLLFQAVSEEENHFNYEENILLQFTTPSIQMTAGDYVLPYIRVQQSANCGSPGATFDLVDGYFELYDEPNGCVTTESNDDPTPYVIDFEYPICHADYMRIKDDKRGKIIVAGREYYIKELKYFPLKNSKFKLIGKESICDACAT